MKNPPKSTGALKSSVFRSPSVPSSPRLLVAWLPLFRLERCGWGARESVALVTPQHGVLRVLAVTDPVAQAGVQLGMSAAQARALVPSLHLEILDSPEAEQADLKELANQLEVLGPHPELLSPDCISVDISRSSGLLGGEAACLELAMRCLRSLNHLSRIWIVDGDRAGAPVAAKALAQWKNKHQILPPGGLADALEELPLSFLPISPPLRASLHALGLRSAGTVAALPSASIAHRYGEEGLWLHMLCRSLPQGPRPAAVSPTLPRVCSTHTFSSPATHIPQLMAVLNQGLEGISTALHRRNQACLKLHIRLELEAHPERHIHVRLGRPMRDPALLSKLLQQRLENLQLRSGIEVAHLTALELCRYDGEQRTLLDRTQSREDFQALFSRLGDSLGTQALFSPRLEETHRPENAWSASTASTASAPPPLERPTLLLPQPRAISVDEGSERPIQILLEGRLYRVQRSQGPERVCGEWWRSEDFDRDYWVIQISQGRRVWVFLDRKTEEWWLHGWFE